ncbi:MAG: AMP-binding protein [Egibacteraceae bacterium]
MARPSAPALVALRLASAAALVAALDEVWAAGEAALPLPADLPTPALERWLSALRPARLIDAEGEHALAGARPVAEGTALVVATSGSTGPPKGVLLSHDALAASTGASLERLGCRPGGDRWLCCLPLHHVAGLQVLLRARHLGTRPVLHDGCDPAAVAATWEGCWISLVPTMLSRLLDAGADLTEPAGVLLGGAAASAGLLARARSTGARIVTSYGMTESAGGCVYDGVPLEGAEVGLAEDGRIRLRGPMLFSGYREGAERPRDTWFATADRGRWSGDGRLEVLGRLDDVILTGGEQADVCALSALLTQHPEVDEATVVGEPDADWGERVVAYVVPVPGTRPTLASLRAFVAARGPRHLAPRALHLLSELPRTELGKLDRGRLPGTMRGSEVRAQP